jgi:hypothetical protein
MSPFRKIHSRLFELLMSLEGKSGKQSGVRTGDPELLRLKRMAMTPVISRNYVRRILMKSTKALSGAGTKRRPG